jgi:tetratricopeptide (TPR) repeat protein
MKLFDQSLEELIRIAEETIYSGNYQQAIKLLETGLMEEPGYPKLHFTIAWIYHYYIEEKARAETHYQLAIYFDEEYKDAYKYLAELYYTNKKLKGLKVWLNKAMKTNEIEKDFVYSMLGKVAESEGNFTEALRCYRKALISCMDNSDAKELKQNIKRTKLKRFKNSWKKWQLKS